MAMFCIHHFVHGLFGGLIVPMNIPIFKKRKKVAKKRKECLQDLDGFVAKNFVVCHQKSPVSWEYYISIIKIIRNLQKKRIIFIYDEIHKE